MNRRNLLAATAATALMAGRLSVAGASVTRPPNFVIVLCDDLGYGVGSACGAEVLLEANTFQRVATPTERLTCADDTLLGLIDAPAGSNYYGDDVGAHRGGDGKEPHDAVFTPPYDYDVEPAQSEWLVVLQRAGAEPGGHRAAVGSRVSRH